jgi:hypothetical protein
MADEKFDEKETEKHGEKEDEKREEKSPEEKWRRDPLSSIVWACILIWVGLVLLAETSGFLASVKDRLDLARLDVWPLIVIGAGIIILCEIGVRLVVPAYRRPVIGSFIFAVILLGIGTGELIKKEIVWPLIIIAVGIIVLLRGFLRGR